MEGKRSKTLPISSFIHSFETKLSRVVEREIAMVVCNEVKTLVEDRIVWDMSMLETEDILLPICDSIKDLKNRSR